MMTRGKQRKPQSVSILKSRAWLSSLRPSPNLEDQVPVFMSPQRQGGPVMSPGTGFHFRRLRLAGLRWR
jgi:hypothetical protein